MKRLTPLLAFLFILPAFGFQSEKNPQKQSDGWVEACGNGSVKYYVNPKYIAKGDNGWRHSKAFTLQNFHEPIQITPRNAAILQENCVRCHADFVHELVEGARIRSGEEVQCVHCHRNVGHGARF